MEADVDDNIDDIGLDIDAPRFDSIDTDNDVDNLEALFRDWSIDPDQAHGSAFTPPTSPGRNESVERWTSELIRQLHSVDLSAAHDTAFRLLRAFEENTLNNDPTHERLQRVSSANQVLYRALFRLKNAYDQARRRNVLLAKQVQREQAARLELESRCQTLQYHLSLALPKTPPNI